MTSGMVTHSVKTTLVHHITISLDGFFTCRLQSKATRLPQKPTAEATISAMVSVGYSSELNGINHPLVINTRKNSNLVRSIGYNRFFICSMDCDGIIIIQIQNDPTGTILFYNLDFGYKSRPAYTTIITVQHQNIHPYTILIMATICYNQIMRFGITRRQIKPNKPTRTGIVVRVFPCGNTQSGLQCYRITKETTWG